MKNGWKSVPLGELCDFSRGLTYKKRDEVEFSSNAVLRANNITLETGMLNFDEIKYINDKIAIPDSKKLAKGALLVCTASGSKKHLGKIAYVDDSYNFAFGGFMGLLRPKTGIDGKYLYWLSCSQTYSDFIVALSDGTNINNLKFSQLSQFMVPKPPLAEQKRIVAILDEAFAGIATAVAHAEKNLANARELFESYLAGALSRRATDWTDKSLISLCSLFVDSAHRTPKYQEEGIPALRPRDVVNGRLSFDDAARVSVSEYEIQSKRHRPAPGDIVYSRELSYGWAAILPETPRVCLSQGMCLFRLNADVDSRFVLYVLNGPLGREQAESAAVGTAHPHINLGDIKLYSIPLPSFAEQKRLRESFDYIAAQTEQLETFYRRKLASLAELRQLILQKAFSGELTVGAVEEAVA